MKNLILFFVLTVSTYFAAQAQEDRFTTAMTELVGQMQAENPASIDWSAIANKLERIGSAEPAEWLPHYYLCYAKLQLAMSAMNQGNAQGVEQFVKASEVHLNTAKELTEMNSELKCMEGYVAQGYIWVDPMNNGPQYAGAAHAAYAAAIAMDETNPRPHLLRGMLTLFTPEFFGGGAEKAMPILTAASTLYENESAEAKGILPSWGKPTNDWMLQKATRDLKASDE